MRGRVESAGAGGGGRGGKAHGMVNAALKTKPGTSEEVPGAGKDWRARKDSNLLPPGS